MTEDQPQAAPDRLDTRDLFIRLITVLGMVGVALGLLLAIRPA